MNRMALNIMKLKELGVYRRFVRNALNEPNENIVITNHRIMGCCLGDCIFGCFVWSRSREGHDFWSRIYAKTHED